MLNRRHIFKIQLLALLSVALMASACKLNPDPPASSKNKKKSTSTDTGSGSGGGTDPRPSPSPSPQPSPQPSPSPGPGTGSGLDPSNGSGGSVQPGQSGTFSGGSFYVPTSYRQSSPVSLIVLANLGTNCFKSNANADGIIVAAINGYGNVSELVSNTNSAIDYITAKYNVDRAKIYLGGYSAGGNFSLIYGTQSANQSRFAGLIAFAGVGTYAGSQADIINQLQTDNTEAIRNCKNYTGSRKVAIFYADGDANPNDGNVTASQFEMTRIKRISGYGSRVTFQAIGTVQHMQPTNASCNSAWSYIKAFNAKNN